MVDKDFVAAKIRQALGPILGLTPGIYSNPTITIGADGRITHAASGAAGSSPSTIATGNNASNTGITTGSDRTLVFTSDSAGWSAGSSADIVLPQAGVIVIALKLNWQISGSPFTTTAGDRQVQIQQIRSASVFDEMKYSSAANNGTGYFESHSYSAIFQVATGDIINLVVNQNSGVTMKCFPDLRIAYT